VTLEVDYIVRDFHLDFLVQCDVFYDSKPIITGTGVLEYQSTEVLKQENQVNQTLLPRWDCFERTKSTEQSRIVRSDYTVSDFHSPYLIYILHVYTHTHVPAYRLVLYGSAIPHVFARPLVVGRWITLHCCPIVHGNIRSVPLK
jgi:hypothetical protein